MRLVFLREDRALLRQDELLDLVAKCVMGGVPIFLSWGHGTLARRCLVNDAAKPAVTDGDKPRFAAVLGDLLDGLIRQVAMDVIAAQNTPRY